MPNIVIYIQELGLWGCRIWLLVVTSGGISFAISQCVVISFSLLNTSPHYYFLTLQNISWCVVHCFLDFGFVAIA